MRAHFEGESSVGAEVLIFAEVIEGQEEAGGGCSVGGSGGALPTSPAALLAVLGALVLRRRGRKGRS